MSGKPWSVGNSIPSVGIIQQIVGIKLNVLLIFIRTSKSNQFNFCIFKNFMSSRFEWYQPFYKSSHLRRRFSLLKFTIFQCFEMGKMLVSKNMSLFRYKMTWIACFSIINKRNDSSWRELSIDAWYKLIREFLKTILRFEVFSVGNSLNFRSVGITLLYPTASI